MSDYKLLPGPFCQCNDRKVHIRRQGKGGYRVICSGCGASGPYFPIQPWHDTKFIAQGKAVKAWNTRTPLSHQKGEDDYEKPPD